MEYTPEIIQNFKWPVSVSRQIKASPEKIWEAITRPGNLEDCHPFCQKNPVFKWPGVGAMDEIYYYSGWILQREFVNWYDLVGYDILIGKEGGPRSYVSWRITDDYNGTARLNITIYPYILQSMPVVFRWMPYRLIIIPGLQNYLVSVVRGFNWNITTGKPVSKNQFGTHRWFSSKDA